MRASRQQFTIGGLMIAIAILAVCLANPATTLGLLFVLGFIVVAIGMMVLVVAIAILACWLVLIPLFHLLERAGSRQSMDTTDGAGR
jgi:hypothetical protein